MHRLLVSFTNHAAKQLTHALDVKLKSASTFRTEAEANRFGAIRSRSPNPTDISSLGGTAALRLLTLACLSA